MKKILSFMVLFLSFAAFASAAQVKASDFEVEKQYSYSTIISPEGENDISGTIYFGSNGEYPYILIYEEEDLMYEAMVVDVQEHQYDNGMTDISYVCNINTPDGAIATIIIREVFDPSVCTEMPGALVVQHIDENENILVELTFMGLE